MRYSSFNPSVEDDVSLTRLMTVQDELWLGGRRGVERAFRNASKPAKEAIRSVPAPLRCGAILAQIQSLGGGEP